MESLKDTCTGKDLYNSVIKSLIRSGLSLDKLASITIDGASSLTGKHSGLVILMNDKIKEDFPLHIVLSFHCIIHQESFCKSSLDLRHVVHPVVCAMNAIRARGLKHRQFQSLLEDMEADFADVLYYTNVCWLSMGKVLKRVWDLKAEILMFFTIKDISCDFSKQMQSEEWICDFAFAVDIMQKLNELNTKLQLLEWGWIQCDNPKCQKWRRIPADELKKLDDVEHWFCHMNPHPDRRDCLDPEEDHKKYDTLARRVGLKYVMSCLEVGSLVWAKMVGYCKWPAVVTRDPDDGSHFTVDLDGDPLSYHVEYLGEEHTHGWIRSAHVELYGHRDKSTLQEPRHKKESKFRRKLNLTAHCSSKSNRKTYKKNKIEDVVAEADRLLGMTCEGRISYCVFQYDHQKVSKNKASVIEKRAKEKSEEIKKFYNKCKLQKTVIGKEHKPNNKFTERGRKERKQSNTKQDSEKGEQSNCKKEIRKHYDKCKFCDLKPTVLPTKRRTHNHPQKDKATSMVTEEWYDFACNNSRRATATASNELSLKPKHFEDSNKVTKPWAEKNLTEKEEAFGDKIMTLSPLTGSPVFFNQSQLNISSSMINKTKEEKFKIDIDMYQRNERVFEHDVKRFMMRNNLKLVSTPHWYNVPVRLFQLFLAVHERGGYKQVCKNKEWRAVFRELTDIQNVKTGNTVKSFYYRNLYPYELYIKGESYDYVLAETKQKKVKVARKKVKVSKIFESNSKLVAIKDKVLGLETVQTSNKQILALDEGAGEDFTDLEIMLGELEQDYDALSHLSEQVDMSKKRMGINILYHDESPNCILSQGIQPANTPSEFGFANLPDHQALQKVPNQVSDGFGVFGSDEDDLMQEMRLMEEEMRAVEEFENFL